MVTSNKGYTNINKKYLFKLNDLTLMMLNKIMLSSKSNQAKQIKEFKKKFSLDIEEN